MERKEKGLVDVDKSGGMVGGGRGYEETNW